MHRNRLKNRYVLIGIICVVALLTDLPLAPAQGTALTADSLCFLMGRLDIELSRHVTIDVKDNYAYVANGQLGVFVIDVSDITNPVLSDTIAAQGSCSDVLLRDQYAIILDEGFGLLTYDVSEPFEPVLVGDLALDGQPGEGAVSGNRLYAADHSYPHYMVWVIDISDPTEPFLLGHVDNLNAENLVADGHILYCMVWDNGNTFNIMDFTEAMNPVVVGSADLPMPIEGGGCGLDVEDPYAYVVISDGYGNAAWLEMIDMINPAEPYIANETRFSVGYWTYTLNLEVLEKVMYLTENDGVQIFDLSDYPEQYSKWKFKTRGIPKDFHLEGENFYIVEEGEGLCIYSLMAHSAKGDVNDDGRTDVLDLVLAVRHILGEIQLTGELHWNADCDGDGVINVLDVMGLVNVILGVGECQGPLR